VLQDLASSVCAWACSGRLHKVMSLPLTSLHGLPPLTFRLGLWSLPGTWWRPSGTTTPPAFQSPFQGISQGFLTGANTIAPEDPEQSFNIRGTHVRGQGTGANTIAPEDLEQPWIVVDEVGGNDGAEFASDGPAPNLVEAPIGG
jgi:hypothetical protein